MQKEEVLKIIFHSFLIFLILFVFISMFQGSRGLWEPDEGRYVNIALNMIRYNDFLIPRLNYEFTHFNKPPLAYWAIAVAIRIFGLKEWAARLPNTLAFCVTGLLLYVIGLHISSRKPWLPVLVYATFILPYAAANVVNADTLLTLWVTLAIFGFLFAILSTKRCARRIFLNIMWTGLGLAFLTKGYPALIVLFAIFIYLFIRKEPAEYKFLFVPEGVILFLVIGFGWYLFVIIKNHNLLTYFLRDELLYRLISGFHERNPNWYMPFVIYVPTLLFGAFPWIAIIFKNPFLIVRIFKRGYWIRKKEQNPEEFFLFLLLFLYTLILFFAKSRLPLYILPMFIPLSLILARRLSPTFNLRRRLTKIIFTGWIVIMLLTKYVFAIIPYDKDSRSVADTIIGRVNRPLKDVIFVDKGPYYGLNFYLGVEVERVTVYNKRSYRREEEPIAQELKEANPEGRYLFAVPERNLFAFKQAVRRARYNEISMGYYALPGHAKLYFFILKKKDVL